MEQETLHPTVFDTEDQQVATLYGKALLSAAGSRVETDRGRIGVDRQRLPQSLSETGDGFRFAAHQRGREGCHDRTDIRQQSR